MLNKWTLFTSEKKRLEIYLDGKLPSRHLEHVL